jgi:AbiTii-like protein
LLTLNNESKETVLQIAKTASVELLEETKSLHDTLLTCKNICKLLQILDKNPWIDLELNGYLVKYKTRDELCEHLPYYRKTGWKFYDLYGNVITLPPDIMDLFSKSIIYHSIHELESKDQLIIGNQFLEKFNKFISEHGMDYASKSVQIHEARISKEEITQVLDGIKNKTQEFLDTVISLLESD